MGCESLVYVANDDTAQVPEGGYVPLGNVARRLGCGCELNGSAIVCRGRGFFRVSGTVTCSQVDASGSTPPVLGVEVTQGGEPVQGGRAMASSAGTVTLPVCCVVRNGPCGAATVALRNAGPAFTASSVALSVERVG